jgi:hypothetical protein
MDRDRHDVTQRISEIMRRLGLEPMTADRAALEASLDELKRASLEDFDFAVSYSKRRDECWRNRALIIAALGHLAAIDYRPDEILEYKQIRADALKPGMFVKQSRSQHFGDGRPPWTMVVIYAQVIKHAELSYDSRLYTECIPLVDNPYHGNLGSSGGNFTPSQLVQAAIGVSKMIIPRPDEE